MNYDLVLKNVNYLDIKSHSFIKGDIEELKLLVPESTIEVLTERYYIEDKSIKRKVLK